MRSTRGDPAPGRRPPGPVRLRRGRAGRRPAVGPRARAVGPRAQRARRPRGRAGHRRAGPGRRPRPGAPVAAPAGRGARPARPSGEQAAALLAHLRGSGLLRSRLLAVLGASSGPGRPPRGPPGDWTALAEDADGHLPRPDRTVGDELRAADAGRRGRRPGDPPGASGWARRRRTRPRRGSRPCGRPTAARSCPWPAATSARGCPPRRSRPSWPTSRPPS